MGSAIQNTSLLDRSQLNDLTFIEKYLECLNETEAVELALVEDNPDFLILDAEDGDLQTIANQVMAKIPVQEALTYRLTQAVQTQRIVNGQWVMDSAAEIFAKCNQNMMIKDSKGNPKVGPFNAIGALRAIELVGKHVDIQAFKETLVVESGPNLTDIMTAAQKRHDEAHALVTQQEMDDATDAVISDPGMEDILGDG